LHIAIAPATILSPSHSLRYARWQSPDDRVGFNVYEDARGILSRNPAVKPAEGFALVDQDWIEQFFR